MAEDRFAANGVARESWLFPNIFRTFRVALDPKKLLLAAAGIVVMAVGWWLLSVTFYGAYTQPDFKNYATRSAEEIRKKNTNAGPEEIERIRQAEEQENAKRFNEDVDAWLEMHKLAGSGYAQVDYQPVGGVKHDSRRVWGGRLRTLPWFEDRGPNPYLLVTGQAHRPWEKDQFWSWFLYTEVPVLIEPLVKFLEPVIQLLNPKTGTLTRFYLLLIILWTLATWALFGGAITRMATVELAGKDPVSITEAVQFVTRRYGSYLLGPIVPLGLVGVLVVVAAVFGLLHMIPLLGDIVVSGIFWPFIILVGLGMALLLVGLVGYPMMYPTISAEGSDTLDALARSYNYVYQSPWSYIFYSLLAILYGAVVIFFVGFMGSLTVYLGKWAVGNTPLIKTADRSPEYLFIYTPTSFGWREVLVSGSPAEEITRMKSEEQAKRRTGKDAAIVERELAEEWRIAGRSKETAQQQYDTWLDSFYVWRNIGAAMVAFWITLVFLMVLGFGYSFFWTASSMIYLMMRRKVDDIDMDEVYLEETEPMDSFGPGPMTPYTPATEPASSSTPVIQETLTVRNDRPAAPAPAPSEPTANTPAPTAAPPSGDMTTP